MMSCGDSAIEQNGASPPYWRIVCSRSVAAACEDLVGVRLVADVPQDLVAGRVEQRVQRYRELAGPEVGPEVPPDLPHRVDDVLAHLLRQALQLLLREPVQVLWPLDAGEDRIVAHEVRV
jgi:hypothetical protein